jgi:hypothetical protein
MANNIRQWVEQHHAYYEVSPYYIVVEERHGSRSVSTRRIQGGFDVDICATTAGNELAPPGPDYELGYADLHEIFAGSHHTPDSSGIEVIPFYASVFLEARNNFQPQTMVRLRVSHLRGLDQPAGPAEGRLLGDIERQLQNLGMRSGRSAMVQSG